LDKFYLDRIDQACDFPERYFHNLMTFNHLATWGLSPEPTAKNLAHEEITRRSKYRPSSYIYIYIYIYH